MYSSFFGFSFESVLNGPSVSRITEAPYSEKGEGRGAINIDS
jgi:hypothetical protein